MLEDKLKESIEISKEENPAMCAILSTVYAALKTGKERELMDYMHIFTEEQIRRLMQEKAQLN